MSTRNQCFTLNNWVDDDLTKLLELEYTYIVIGKEVGKGGTPHLQGYIEFKTPKRLTTLKNINVKIHWEKRKGSAEQAANYCKKDNDYIEKGELSNQGKRTDLEIACEMLKNKVSIRRVALEKSETYVKYHRGLEKLRNFMIEPRAEKPNVFWRHGKAGTGKTRFVFDNFNREDIYVKDNSKWWDGYEGQLVILIDDFDLRGWEFRDLLKVLDRYPYQGQTKGSYVNINSPWIYITCEYEPKDIWPDENELNQILRRVENVTHVTEVAGNTNAAPKKREDNVGENNV